MSTAQNIVEKAQSLGLKESNLFKFQQTLEKYKDKSQHLEFINDLFKSELSKNYFDINHLKRTYKYKELLNHSFTQDTSTLIGLTFPFKKNIKEYSPILSSLNTNENVLEAVESFLYEGQAQNCKRISRKQSRKYF